MTPVGLPHSGIHGSKPAYDSPWHFAVNRALLRLLAPRHPPYALSSLTYSIATSRFTQYLRIEVNSFDFTSFLLYAVFKEQALDWWRLQGSNLRPSACKADALPAELNPRFMIPTVRFRSSPVCSSFLTPVSVF